MTEEAEEAKELADMRAAGLLSGKGAAGSKNYPRPLSIHLVVGNCGNAQVLVCVMRGARPGRCQAQGRQVCTIVS